MMCSILVLYSEAMDYTISCLIRLQTNFDIKVHLVCWDKKKLTPFEIAPEIGIEVKYKSEFATKEELYSYCKKVAPQHLFVSGWMDRDYLYVASKIRSREVKVTAFLDNQWKGNVRQKIAVILASILVRNKFDNLWVSGIYQYEFAKRLGYKNPNIFRGFYSANLELFNKIYQQRLDYLQIEPYPKNILFLGRLAKEKGIDLLIEVFHKILLDFPEWTLTIVGNGPLKNDLIDLAKENSSKIVFKDFIKPEELSVEIIKSGIFCLPSTSEPWGVVVHEMAASGLPLITSDCCGASSEFLSEYYNGVTFKSGDLEDFEHKLRYILRMDSPLLRNLGTRSNLIAQHINQDVWASTAYKIITTK